ncbi:HNH endonuclease [Clostridium perfringens]|uniref:HNH endonuclease n=1 Tax=Clostridium perfringens TaxID=1502 RepID=A0AAP4A9Y7_CLOPF|nr:HNH endonuclease [Clostridium perfringens]MDH2337306.1 HNH endonuclease [Clostridium perfringens]
MARAPNEKVKKAYELFKEGYKLVDISKELDIPSGTVRRWKKTYNWDNENVEVNIKKIKKEKTINRINKVPKEKKKKESIYFDMITELRKIIKDDNSSNAEKISACNTMITLVTTPGIAKKLNSLTRKMDLKETNAITDEEWNKSIDYFRNDNGEQCCAYCGKHYSRLEKEHIKPLTKGGKTTISNIIPACRICNTTKNNRDFVEWYLGSSVYDEERMNKIFDYIEKWGDS